MRQLDFARHPFVVTWDAGGMKGPRGHVSHESALPARERSRIIQDLADLRPRVLLLGCSAQSDRPDLVETIREASDWDLRVGVVSGDPRLLTRAVILRIREAGAQMISVGLNGAVATTHETGSTGVGDFEAALEALETMAILGVPAQVRTRVSASNLGELPWIARLVAMYGARLWTVSYPVALSPAAGDRLSRRFEESLRWLATIGQRQPFAVHTLAAPQIRRVRRQLSAADQPRRLIGAGYDVASAEDTEAVSALNDGNGMLHLDARGNVYPSAALPAPVGNARFNRLVDLYRNAPVFRELRDRALISGLCGDCRFTPVCGGSRARAYAITGSYLSSDPLCGRVASALRRGQGLRKQTERV